MIGRKFLGWLVGYVRVRSQTPFPEKMVNILVANDIGMWDIIVGDGWLEFSTDVFSYRKSWGLHHKTGSSLEVLWRGGLYIWLRTLRRRKLLIAGFFCFWLLVYWLAGFVWTLEISGLETIKEDEFLEFVEEHGLYRGSLHRRLDFDTLESGIIIEFPQIAWAAVERQGTYVKITVVEKEPVPKEIDTPIDIVAAYDGIISAIMVLQGRPLVEPGMTVVVGDVLIAGYREGENVVHASGNVKATVYLEGYGECALAETEFIPTGNTQVQKFIEFGERRLLISGRKPKYELYNTEESSTDIRWNSWLPVQLVERTYTEIEAVTTEYSPEEARRLAEERALISLHLQTYTDAELLKKEIKDITLEHEDIFRVKVYLELEVNIGIEDGHEGGN
ncbi:MAG: hypothetical protein FH749_09200 [Firmicutes bacterium]|nr:hypothetical protein [Bacillota bacterium]